MRVEQFRWLAAVIAAYPGRRLVGRVRLQKTINLLQRRGLPTKYSYITYHYGPYSEGVQADTNLLEHLGLITETKGISMKEREYSTYEAIEDAFLPDISRFKSNIDIIANADATVLELAATFETFLDDGYAEATAWQMVKAKKPTKYSLSKQREAEKLLSSLSAKSN